jgi:drug/metabolite transporter (DMT)-like permease
MIWFALSLGSALAESIADVLGKLSAARYGDWSVTLWQRVGALCLIFPAFCCAPAHIENYSPFIFSVAMSVMLNVVASIYYVQALRDAPLSLSLPILKLSPVFLLVTGPLINHEPITLFGMVGVLLTVVGTYTMNFSKISSGLMAPLTELWRNVGMRKMLGVALLWGISSPFDKEGIRASSPTTYLVVCSLLSIILTLIIGIAIEGRSRLFDKRAARMLIPRGLCGGIVLLLQMHAFVLAPVAYVISVKRTSTLFGLLWGRLIFHEQHMLERTIGALITFVGMVIVIFLGVK